jgi:hypothetical protein
VRVVETGIVPFVHDIPVWAGEDLLIFSQVTVVAQTPVSVIIHVSILVDWDAQNRGPWVQIPLPAIGQIAASSAKVSLAVVIGVEPGSDADLFKIADALHRFGFVFGFAQGRKEHAGEDCNNGNDDKQLDQGEAYWRESPFSLGLATTPGAGLETHSVVHMTVEPAQFSAFRWPPLAQILNPAVQGGCTGSNLRCKGATARNRMLSRRVSNVTTRTEFSTLRECFVADRLARVEAGRPEQYFNFSSLSLSRGSPLVETKTVHRRVLMIGL